MRQVPRGHPLTLPPYHHRVGHPSLTHPPGSRYIEGQTNLNPIYLFQAWPPQTRLPWPKSTELHIGAAATKSSTTFQLSTTPQPSDPGNRLLNYWLTYCDICISTSNYLIPCSHHHHRQHLRDNRLLLLRPQRRKRSSSQVQARRRNRRQLRKRRAVY